MSKHEWRLFFLSFSLTLLVSGFIGLFFIADAQNSQYRVGDVERVYNLEQTGAFTWRFEALGVGGDLNFQPLAQAQSLRKEYACLLTPRFLRTAEQIAALLDAAYGEEDGQ